MSTSTRTIDLDSLAVDLIQEARQLGIRPKTLFERILRSVHPVPSVGAKHLREND